MWCRSTRPAGLRRHAVGRVGGGGDQGSQGARLQGDVLSVHLHGRCRTETLCPIRIGGGRPAGLSLARAHHLRPGARCAGTVDKTAACASQVAAFVGAAQASDFAIDGETVLYSGPAEWSFRRFILHYAHLCEAAGGVDAFLIGSEMRGATTLRSSASAFPFVDALVDLAGDIRGVLRGSTKMTYGADWTEHRGHQPQDGSGDVYFHLDPLWASSDIDAVGIDVYWPLADWRDGEAPSRPSGRVAIDLRSGLSAQQYQGRGGLRLVLPVRRRDGERGERGAHRANALADHRRHVWQAVGLQAESHQGVVAEPSLQSPGRCRVGRPTAWVPQSKPIWFTEVGCPAVDKGANQPNVFIDPKSSESFAPYFSRSMRDDLVQRRYIKAMLELFRPEPRGLRGRIEPGIGGLRWPHGRCVAHLRLHLGRAPVSRFSLRLVGVVGRRQLGAGALAYGTGRRRRARGHRAASLGGLRLYPLRGDAALWLPRRVRHRSPDVGTRGAAAARPCLSVRCL